MGSAMLTVHSPMECGVSPGTIGCELPYTVGCSEAKVQYSLGLLVNDDIYVKTWYD